MIGNQLKVIENYLSLKCAENNKDLVTKYVEELNSSKGKFSQHGLWKLKSKLCRKSVDPPMAKLDTSGQFITSPNLLKDLYLRTYQDRLSHRVMKTGYEDILVRAECVRQCNEVAIKLGIISPLSLSLPSSAKSPRESCRRVLKFCMGS